MTCTLSLRLFLMAFARSSRDMIGKFLTGMARRYMAAILYAKKSSINGPRVNGGSIVFTSEFRCVRRQLVLIGVLNFVTGQKF